MKIGLDISLTIGEKAGVGYYTYNLVKNLAKIDKINNYILYPFYYYIFHPEFKEAFCPEQKNFKLNLEWLSKKTITKLWFSNKIPKEWFFPKVDVLHSTTFCVPTKGYKKIIATIYDVSFLTHPEFHIEENIAHCFKGTSDAVKHADKIIAISRNTKNDLIKYFNCDPAKIAVTYLGANKRFVPINDKYQTETIKKKYGIKNKYIFNLGSIEPRKNISGLIEAYAMLPNELKNEYDLVIAGGKGWKNSGIYNMVKQLHLTEYIAFIGFVDDDDLPYLYNEASVFVYPSHYEGFGLPVLEAMACGCPVISSNISSIPEVVGEAGILINPTDTEELKENIKKVLVDVSLAKEMSRRGIIQSQKFNWENCAKKTLGIYLNAINID
jgi:glycosyltransferase involved in cell wall biosynthesis